MGKKKQQFVDKKNAQRFRLIPASAAANEEFTETFTPSKDDLEEQHKFGIFYDDNYDYMQHLRDRNERSVMLGVDEVKTVLKAPSIPPAVNDGPIFDEDMARALDGVEEEGEGDLEDDFIALAGGVVDEKLMAIRPLRPFMEGDSDYEDEEEEEEMFNHGYEDYDMEDEDEEEEEAIEAAHEEKREVDDAFAAMLEADYRDEQMGELEGDAYDTIQGLEPSDSRVRKLTKEKRGLPEYDEKLAREYVKQRMAVLASQPEEEMEEVELDVSAAKRMKWDCESFATQYSNIYNRPVLIKEMGGKLSRRALKRLEKTVEEKEEEMETEEEEGDDGEDGQSICTTMSMRRRGETTEERKARKGAVKDARRVRRVEKKENKVAFAVEHRKAKAERMGNAVKARTLN